MNIREIKDRPLPTALDKECIESAKRGSEGRGLSTQTMNESLADLNQGVSIQE